MPLKLRPLALMLVVLAPVALGQTPAAAPAPAASAEAQQATPAADTTATAPATAPATPAVPAPQTAPAEASADQAAPDQSATDEALAEEGMGGPPRLAKDFTGITGRVVDARTKEAIIEATVKVVSGAQKQVLTDLDGYYVLKLEPGVYELRVFEGVYQGRRIQHVVVQAGKATHLDVALSPDAGAVQEVVVEVKADRRSESALLQERKKAAAVSDAISSQEIQRTPDSNAGDAVKRVVSATIVDNKFVLLRGLGGRYSVTLLNGALLPSPEPDEPSVPLDLFPTALLANLNIVKTYTSDLPGTFGGGALQLETNSYPAKFELKPTISLGGDTQTTLRSRNTQAGGPLDALGFMDPSRRLPAGVPTTCPLESGYCGLTTAKATEIGKTFVGSWEGRLTRALPNATLGASVGDTLRFGNRRFGYLASVQYSHKEAIQRQQAGRVAMGSAGPVYDSTANAQLGGETASLGGLLNASYQFSTDNELTFFSLSTRGTESQTVTTQGVVEDGSTDPYFQGTRLLFVNRALLFNQLRGFHRLGVWDDAELDWQANFSRVDRSQPDTRDVTYSSRDARTFFFKDQPGNGDRFFAELAEQSTGATANLSLPLGAVRLKLGGMSQLSFRDFSARRFHWDMMDGYTDLAAQSPDQLLSPANVGTAFLPREATFPEDAYRGQLGIFAGFASADWKPVEALRVVGGVRYEFSSQTLFAQSKVSTSWAPGREASLVNGDVLPSLNLTWAVGPTVNVRTGYSYTLARPTFREIAPFQFFDFVRRRNVQGNPGLQETRIHNGDARVEWFPGESEVLAASLFYKRFSNPIERVIVSVGTGDVSYRNAASADVWGAELEARTGLGRLASALSDFKLGANLTLIQSQVDLGSSGGSSTSLVRPLQGQSPYVVNLNLGYDRQESGTGVALLYNVYGPRIADVGFDARPDVYEQPFHKLDLSVTQKLGGSAQLKLTGSNLLNSPISLTAGGLSVLRYRPGIAFQASLGWTL